MIQRAGFRGRKHKERYLIVKMEDNAPVLEMVHTAEDRTIVFHSPFSGIQEFGEDNSKKLPGFFVKLARKIYRLHAEDLESGASEWIEAIARFIPSKLRVGIKSGTPANPRLRDPLSRRGTTSAIPSKFAKSTASIGHDRETKEDLIEESPLSEPSPTPSQEDTAPPRPKKPKLPPKSCEIKTSSSKAVTPPKNSQKKICYYGSTQTQDARKRPNNRKTSPSPTAYFI